MAVLVRFLMLGLLASIAQGRKVAVSCEKPATCYGTNGDTFLCTTQSYSCCVDGKGVAHLVDRTMGEECCIGARYSPVYIPMKGEHCIDGRVVETAPVTHAPISNTERLVECNDITHPLCCNGVRISNNHLCDRKTGKPVLKRHKSHNDVCNSSSFNNIVNTCRNDRLIAKRDQCLDREMFHCCHGIPVLKTGQTKQNACCVGDQCQRKKTVGRFESSEPVLVAILIQRSTRRGNRCVHKGMMKTESPVQPGIPEGWQNAIIRERNTHCIPLETGEFYFVLMERRSSQLFSSRIKLTNKNKYTIKKSSRKMARSYDREMQQWGL